MYEKSLTRRVLVFLKDYPGASVKDVATHLGININLARAILYRLKNKGIIEKVGNGYILTKSGEQIIDKISSKEYVVKREHIPNNIPVREMDKTLIEPEAKTQEQEVEETTSTSTTQPVLRETRDEPERDLMKAIKTVEERIRHLEKELDVIKKEVNRIKNIAENMKQRIQSPSAKKSEVEKLPRPVMPVLEARNILGDRLHALTYTGKIVVIGSLAIDGDFYKNFISKFPIGRREAEKLPEEEKILLEEMKKEGKVYLHCGKEYRLV